MASAVFVEGTPSHQLIALSHKALSQKDLDFMVCAYPSNDVVF
jgi:Xaa-Pro aminopeptidase